MRLEGRRAARCRCLPPAVLASIALAMTLHAASCSSPSAEPEEKNQSMASQKAVDPLASGVFGDPVIFDAALSGDLEWITNLIKAGAQPNQRNGLGETPALTAAMADQWEACLLLLTLGSDPQAPSNVGSTIAYEAYESRVKPDSEAGRSRDLVIARLKSLNVQFPPYTPEQVRTLREEGRWPSSRGTNDQVGGK